MRKRGKTRLFDGKKFYYKDYTFSEEVAQNKAEELREEGYNTRIVKYKSEEYEEIFHIFIRKPSKRKKPIKNPTIKLKPYEAQALKKFAKADMIEYGMYLDVDKKGLERADIIRGQLYKFKLPPKHYGTDWEIFAHTHPSTKRYITPSEADMKTTIFDLSKNRLRKDFIIGEKQVLSVYIKDYKKFMLYRTRMDYSDIDKMYKEAESNLKGKQKYRDITRQRLKKKGLRKAEIEKRIDVESYREKEKDYRNKIRKILEKNTGISFKNVYLTTQKIKIIEPSKEKRKIKVSKKKIRKKSK